MKKGRSVYRILIKLKKKTDIKQHLQKREYILAMSRSSNKLISFLSIKENLGYRKQI